MCNIIFTEGRLAGNNTVRRPRRLTYQSWASVAGAEGLSLGISTPQKLIRGLSKSLHSSLMSLNIRVGAAETTMPLMGTCWEVWLIFFTQQFPFPHFLVFPVNLSNLFYPLGGERLVSTLHCLISLFSFLCTSSPSSWLPPIQASTAGVCLLQRWKWTQPCLVNPALHQSGVLWL